MKKSLPEVLAKLEDAGYETSCHMTTVAGDATSAAKIAVERGYDVVIAAGGDGTIYEVINGLAGAENLLSSAFFLLVQQTTLHVLYIYLSRLKELLILLQAGIQCRLM